MSGKYYSKQILIISSLVIMGACSAEMPQAPFDSEGVISFKVQAQYPVTKTIIADDGNCSAFSFKEGDMIGLFANHIALKNIWLECTNESTGIFNRNIKYTGKTQDFLSLTYGAYSPFYESSEIQGSTISAVLPANQVAPFDGMADYLVANPLTSAEDVQTFPDLSFTFSTHLFAIVKLSITNASSLLAGEKVLGIGLRSKAGFLAGSFSFDVMDPSQPAVFSTNPDDLYQEVRVIYPISERPDIGENITHTVYAVINPGSYDAGDLELVVSTTNYLFTLATTNSVTLSSNEVTVFPEVELSDARVSRITDAKDILSFSLSDGITVFEPFDISDGVISVQVPNQMDLSHVTASFTHNGASVLVNGIEQKSGESIQDYGDFTNPVQFEVLSEAGGSQLYSVRIFDLPVVSITTPHAITNNTTWVDDCSIIIREADGTITDYGNTVQVRGRGNTTWAAPKKPFTFKLASKASVLGMPADKRWNLLANWFDRTLIRNDVSFEVARRARGLAWTSKGVFVEVILNGEFLGSYYLCEHIKISKDRVNITEIKASDTSDEAITGGYLLEYDGWKDHDLYFSSSILMSQRGEQTRIKFKSPDDPGFDLQWAWIENYVHNLESILINEDAVLAHQYLDYMDLDSYADYWLVYEIAGTHEPNNPGSCYMYKDRGGKLHAGPVWDFDNYTYWATPRGFRNKEALYYKYLFQDPLFVYKVKERWPPLKEALNSMPEYIDSVICSIYRSAARNGEMWPATGTYNHDGDLFVADASSRLKKYFSDRIIELDGLIKALTATPVDGTNGNENFNGQTTPDFGFGF